MRPVSRRHSRRGLVGGSTFRRTPISRSPLDKNPMPGHLSELHPVNEVHTKGQFFRASFGKNPRFQIQLDKRPLSPGTGNPRTVPAGEYAREVLASLKVWDALEPKLILAENVRQALVYVIRGEVEAGLVYATDAQSAGREVEVVAAAPKGSHRPVIYPIAVVTASKVPALARAFVDLALGDEGQEGLRAHGFHSATKEAAR